jgi:hypothetical protein
MSLSKSINIAQINWAIVSLAVCAIALSYGATGCKSEDKNAKAATPAKATPAVKKPVAKKIPVKKAPAPNKTGGSTLNAGLLPMIVNLNMPHLDACYQAGLKKNKELKGTAQLNLVIGASGTVDKAEIMTRDLRDINVLKCIKAVVLKWKFARTGTDPIRTMYPVTFPVPKRTKGKSGQPTK